MQGLYGTIHGLFSNGIIEPGGRIQRIKFLGHGKFVYRQLIALFFEVGFAQITSYKRVIRVKTCSDSNFPAPFFQITLPDLCQSEAQPREGNRLIQLNRLFKGLFGISNLYLGKVGKSQNSLRKCQIRIQDHSFLRRFQCSIEIP